MAGGLARAVVLLRPPGRQGLRLASAPDALLDHIRLLTVPHRCLHHPPTGSYRNPHQHHHIKPPWLLALNTRKRSQTFMLSTSAREPRTPAPDDNEQQQKESQPKPTALTLRSRVTGLASSARHFVVHVWSGAKLLAADVRVSARILWRILQGKAIGRRERNMLVATGTDLARMVPFSFFILIPFMEFALPFALYLFPNMLPSQFQDKMKREEGLKKQLKMRIELAKYLSDVVEDQAKKVKSKGSTEETQKAAAELTNFLSDLRDGKPVEERQIFKFARLFSDEITIEGAVRPQLAAMCKYMGLGSYGSDNILRFRLRSRINAIKSDDMEIMWEGGVDTLSDDEVAKACRDRGIRSLGIPKMRQRRQLQDWVDMSQRKEVPSSLMILSRAFFYTEGPEGAIKEVLAALPQDVVDDVTSASTADTEQTTVQRLEERKRQEKLVRKSQDEQDRLEQDLAKKAAAEADAEVEMEANKETTSAAQAESVEDDPVPTVQTVTRHEEELKQTLFEEESKSPDDQSEVEETEMDYELGEEERAAIRRIVSSLTESFSDSAVENERKELEELQGELKDVEKMLGADGASESQVQRLGKMVKKLEREIEKVDQKVGLKMKLLDADNDGVIRLHEVTEALDLMTHEKNDRIHKEILQRLDTDNDGLCSRDDLIRVLREVMGSSEQEEVEKS